MDNIFWSLILKCHYFPAISTEFTDDAPGLAVNLPATLEPKAPGLAVNLPATIQPKPLELPTLDSGTKEGALKSLPVKTFFRVWEAYANGQDKGEQQQEEEGTESDDGNAINCLNIFSLLS